MTYRLRSSEVQGYAFTVPEKVPACTVQGLCDVVASSLNKLPFPDVVCGTRIDHRYFDCKQRSKSLLILKAKYKCCWAGAVIFLGDNLGRNSYCDGWSQHGHAMLVRAHSVCCASSRVNSQCCQRELPPVVSHGSYWVAFLLLVLFAILPRTLGFSF